MEKVFFKLKINSACGKTIENFRNRVGEKKKKRRKRQKKKTVKIVSNDNNEKDYLKHARKPTFISIKIFDKNYAAIYQTKPIKF